MLAGFDPALLKNADNRALLDKLPAPKNVFGYFLMCTETPRPSGSLTQIREKIVQIGKAAGLDVAVDGAGNVRIRKPATRGHEHAVKVALQCHMDMVPTKLDALKDFDFAKDPLHVFLDGDYLKAKGTTLGGDDGAGVASCLGLLTQPGTEHGPLECLFTVDEEVGMPGARNLAKAPFLQSTMCMNLDSEDEHAICIGCAGAFDKKIILPAERDPAWPQHQAGFTLHKVTLDGLLGGHSGLHIGLGRANAVVTLARLLSHACDGCQLQLAEIEGGNARNAIPKAAHALVFVRNDQQAAFTKSLHDSFAKLKDEFVITEAKEPEVKDAPRPAPKMALAADKHATEQAVVPLTAAATQKVLDMILNAPHGVVRFSAEVSGAVETSVCMSYATLLAHPHKGAADELVLVFMARSSADQQLLDLDSKLDAFARLCGAKATMKENFYTGWQPDAKAKLLAEVEKAHVQLANRKPHVYAVHAGLECGFMMAHYPGMQCVSIGPQVDGAHTTDERMKVSSVAFFYDWLLAALKNLAQVAA